MSSVRQVKNVFRGVLASDGAGVRLTRIIGSSALDRFDPFLLLDHFGSEQPNDYIAGFPPHPHRGFETVTYMLTGKMRHEDSAGNTGLIESGGVQWMTAGKGIIHSEMPEQDSGELSGFQLWVNLPQKHKMTTPRYQEKANGDIQIEQGEGITIKVIAGETERGTKGVIDNTFTDPIYWDIHQITSSSFSNRIPNSHNTFIYVYEGSILIEGTEKHISKGDIALLGDGNRVNIKAISNANYLLIGGKPLNEPIARRGPFVMTTQEEIEQAFEDYQSGILVTDSTI